MLYVANVRLPSERANAAQILQQCDALATRGAHVTILAPARKNRFALADADIPRHFGLRRPPEIERLPTIDFIESVPPRLQRLPFLLQSFTFARALKQRLVREHGRGAMVWSRDAWSLTLNASTRSASLPTFFEAHDLPQRPSARRKLAAALRGCAGVAAITHGLKDELIAAGVAAEAIEVLPDGVDLARFAGLPDAFNARRLLGLPPSRPTAVYAGSLMQWKGVDVLVDAAARSTAFDAVIVGGRAEDRDRVARRIAASGAKNVQLMPAVAPSEVPAWLAGADVIVLPNSARTPISERYTSPLKLFEAMASGRPIVASDLPSLREILDESTARFVAPDDPAALAAGIETSLADRAGSAARAARAKEKVAAYSWDARAARILDLMRRKGGVESRA